MHIREIEDLKMTIRRNIGRASPLILVLLTLGVFIVTYNLISFIFHSRNLVSENGSLDGSLLSDPVVGMPRNVKKNVGAKKLFHVALTSTDAPYSKWQCRIMYYWYKKVRDMPESEMGGFTRVLHSGNPDDLMKEIPTLVVDPLPTGLDRVRFLSFIVVTLNF